MIENFYKKSPYLIKVFLLNIKAYLNYHKRYTKEYYKYLAIYNENWLKPRNEILDFQKQELIRLLKECFEYVPYYKHNFEEKGITKSMIDESPYEVLNSLDLLSKIDRKNCVGKLVNNNPKRSIKEIGFTSGTSGSPTKNFVDSETLARDFALWSRFHNSIGISNRKKKSVRFSGRLIVNSTQTKPPFWILNHIENQLFMSSYHLKDENIVSYIKKINSFEPQLLDGYPSTFYILAKYINNNNLKITFVPDAITTTAESLYDYQKLEIEKAFNCKVYNQYASSEGSPFITTCVEGNLHINEDSGIFEFLNNDNKPANPGEIAKMVVTSLRNFKTPLLRYDILDTVLLGNKDTSCPCNCDMPIIEKIIGREDDILWTKEKGYVGRMDTAYKGLDGFVTSQIIQNSQTEFVINNVVDDKFTKAIEKQFISNLKERLGYNISINMNYVDEIPLGANGKFDAVQRNFEIEI